jgi:hypothetical protein
MERSCNLKEEPGMAKHRKPSTALSAFEPFLQGVGKSLVAKVYGPNGMPWGTKFAELEQAAVDLGQAISRQMINHALRQQAADEPSMGTDATICAVCGAAFGEPEGTPDTEARIVQTRVGDAQWLEPKRYCDRCRKSFFPSVQEPGH